MKIHILLTFLGWKWISFTTCTKSVCIILKNYYKSANWMASSIDCHCFDFFFCLNLKLASFLKCPNMDGYTWKWCIFRHGVEFLAWWHSVLMPDLVNKTWNSLYETTSFSQNMKHIERVDQIHFKLPPWLIYIRLPGNVICLL